MSLKLYDVLIFEEIISPGSLSKADADPAHRHAVRLTGIEPATDPLNGMNLLEVVWHESDRLPFPLCISLTKDGKLHQDISVARGNIVLADHGYTLKDQQLVPDIAENNKYRPLLKHKGITAAVQYFHDAKKNKAAAESLVQDPHEALPSISLSEKNGSWSIAKDLLGTDRFTMEFVAEMEDDGSANLRFGDDIKGKRPETGFQPAAIYRIGNGRYGNVGPDTICRIVSDEEAIVTVRNPLPASGGKDPETQEEIREFAPQAFRKQERAVTESDYAKKLNSMTRFKKQRLNFVGPEVGTPCFFLLTERMEKK